MLKLLSPKELSGSIIPTHLGQIPFNISTDLEKIIKEENIMYINNLNYSMEHVDTMHNAYPS